MMMAMISSISLSRQGARTEFLVAESGFLSVAVKRNSFWKIVEPPDVFRSQAIFSPKERSRGTRRRPHQPLARPSLARAWGWCGRLRALLNFPFGLLIPCNLKTSGGSTIFQREFRFAATERNPDSATRNSVLAPCQDGELEEIIAIIITDASQSTIMIPPSMCE